MHKRSSKRLLERKIRGLIFRHSYHDYKRAESVCRITRVEIASLLHEPLMLHVIPDVEKGEALVDYRSHRTPAPRRIFCLKRGNETCGVIVYSYPPSTCFARRLMLPKMRMKELNEKLSNISRVVVHPKYRTMGLGTKLIKETLPLAGTERVEMSAAMARYDPFAEKAGMKRVAEQQPPKEALFVVEILKNVGFNIELISSTKYVLNKLHSLTNEDTEKIRRAFIRSRHIRFMKSFSYHLPFGKKEDYEMMIAKAELEKLAHLINICSFLMQKKVYLFWSIQHRDRRIRNLRTAKHAEVHPHQCALNDI